MTVKAGLPNVRLAAHFSRGDVDGTEKRQNRSFRLPFRSCKTRSSESFKIRTLCCVKGGAQPRYNETIPCRSLEALYSRSL
jgi:hypothetical protein